MKKKILALVLGMMVVAAVTGCGSKKEETAAAVQTEESIVEESSISIEEESAAEESSIAEESSEAVEEETTEENAEADGATAADVVTYMLEIDKLNDATEDFMNALVELMAEPETMGDKLDSVRTTIQPFYDIATVTPPAGYEAAHADLVASSANFGDVINEYLDVLKSAFDGTTDMDTYTQKMTELETKINDSLAAIGTSLEAIEAVGE